MKKILVLIIGFLVLSCTDEADEQTYTTNIRNSSNSTIEVKGYNVPRELVFDEMIQSNNSSSNCTTSSETFLGLSCRIDSLVVTFNNDKGYITTSLGENNLSFINRNPLLGNISDFNDLGNNTFEFEITEDDFDNANDLP